MQNSWSIHQIKYITALPYIVFSIDQWCYKHDVFYDVDKKSKILNQIVLAKLVLIFFFTIHYVRKTTNYYVKTVFTIVFIAEIAQW